MSSGSESLLDHFADALIIVTPDDARILSWNRGAEQMFGHSFAEVIGRSLIDILVPPQHRDAEAALLDAARQRGSATYEAVRQRKDGANIYVDVSMRAILDGRGGVQSIAISKKDV